jgi:hypothetical protein
MFAICHLPGLQMLWRLALHYHEGLKRSPHEQVEQGMPSMFRSRRDNWSTSSFLATLRLSSVMRSYPGLLYVGVVVYRVVEPATWLHCAIIHKTDEEPKKWGAGRRALDVPPLSYIHLSHLPSRRFQCASICARCSTREDNLSELAASQLASIPQSRHATQAMLSRFNECA